MSDTIKSRRFFLTACAIVLLVAAAQPLSATTYYVNSVAGSDSNDGRSTSTAWRTIGRVNSSMSSFGPGDHILFMGGSTYSDTNLFITCDGSAGSPITFGTYGTGRARFSGKAIQCGHGNGYITIDNFEVFNTPGDGIAFFKESNWQYEITVRNCYVHGAGNSGIILVSVNGYLIENCRVQGSYNGNIVIYGSDYPIRNGIIRGCTSYDAIQNDGICIHEGDYNEPCGPNHYIVGCKTYGNAEEGIDISDGTYVTIQGCESYGDVYAGIIVEGDNCTVRRNKIHHGHNGVHIGANNATLESNLIYSNGKDQILIEPYLDVSGINIYHNTIVHGPNSSGIILDISPRARGIVVKNNIFTSTQYSSPGTYVRFMDGASPASTNSHFDYNVYWRRDNNSSARWYAAGANRSFATWQSSLGQDTHGQWADPRFLNLTGNDFHLQAGSPCRDTGTNVGVQRDYEGTSIPQGAAPDVGAYEYASDSPPPPLTLQADINASPTSGEVPLTVSFHGSASGGTAPYSYSWQFGDGGTSTAQNPGHTYGETGTYTVTLTVTDNHNDSDSDSVNIQVYTKSINSLNVGLSASKTSGVVPLSVTFKAIVTGGTAPYAYFWNFDDGSKSTLQSTTHSFSQTGTYGVTLTVTDGHNTRVVKSITIKVSEKNLVADFACKPDQLIFGANGTENKTPVQEFTIVDQGLGFLSWSISTDHNWLSCSPSSGTGTAKVSVLVDPTGLPAGEHTARIAVSAPNAVRSPRHVTVTLTVYDQDFSPIGAIDSPLEGTIVSGNFPFSGWALDDIQVTKVQIKRSVQPDDIGSMIDADGLIYLGDAFFCEGARPDIPEEYADYPMTHKAGWGYILPTYQLPNKGNGSFTIHAIAHDSSGHIIELGARTITASNNLRTLPFGAIDTPGNGEELSGEEYTSNGWVLTPPPKSISPDGNTIWAWIDGTRVGNVSYNQYRQDIASMFPDCLNSQGAGGSFAFNPVLLRQGIHTLIWSATDDAGETDAIDVRYFQVSNADPPISQPGYQELKDIYQEDTGGGLNVEIQEVRKGYELAVDPDAQNTQDGSFVVNTEEMEPVEIRFKAASAKPLSFYGWGEQEWHSLPPGASLKQKEGVFSWIPTPGFLGSYIFHFVCTDGTYIGKPVQVTVQVSAKCSESGVKKHRQIKR